MIYISIPVHTTPEVIINQMGNFRKYFSEAVIILHLSRNATFTIHDLEKQIVDANLAQVLVNPKQVETEWGSIIDAHLENIRYIIRLGNAEKVIFHSSNDMLVKRGGYDYVKDKQYIFHQRKCFLSSLWWVSRRALKDHPLVSYFNNQLQASQIEGSMYSITLLKELVDEIEKGKLIISHKPFYPREEIIFSSFAKLKGIVPDGLPYVFSEVHQFDRKFFGTLIRYKYLFNFPLYLGKLMIQLLEKYLLKEYDYSINKNTILAIIQQDETYLQPYLSLNDDKDVSWRCYSVGEIFAVKRVNRKINDPVRLYINQLD